MPVTKSTKSRLSLSFSVRNRPWGDAVVGDMRSVGHVLFHPVGAVFNRHSLIVGAVDDQSWHRDTRQVLPKIGFGKGMAAGHRGLVRTQRGQAERLV